MPPIDNARRAFLRGNLCHRSGPRRMPWAHQDFEDLCQRCDDCISACEEQIIVRGDGGFPVVDFRRGGCTFCGACADACRHQALRDPQGTPWSLKASIGAECLEARGITCRACGDACEERAIRFLLRVGGGADLRLEQQACTGCGACLAVCPVDAVVINPPSSKPTLSNPVAVAASAEIKQAEELS